MHSTEFGMKKPAGLLCIHTRYDTGGRLVTQTAYDAKGSAVVPESTKYLYTSTIDGSLQTAEVEPDSADSVTQNGSLVWTINSGTDHTSTSYFISGQPLTFTDQRGVAHSHTYDFAGDKLTDSVTSFGNLTQASGAEWASEIKTLYNDLGQVYQVTTFNGATTVNQVQDQYDGWGNMTQEWQAVSSRMRCNSRNGTRQGRLWGNACVARKLTPVLSALGAHGRDPAEPPPSAASHTEPAAGFGPQPFPVGHHDLALSPRRCFLQAANNFVCFVPSLRGLFGLAPRGPVWPLSATIRS
jgi:hypothetical protein